MTYMDLPLFTRLYRIWLWFWGWMPKVGEILFVDIISVFEEWFNTVANTIVQYIENIANIDIPIEISFDLPFSMILIEWLEGTAIWYILAIAIFTFCFSLAFSIIKAIIDIIL